MTVRAGRVTVAEVGTDSAVPIHPPGTGDSSGADALRRWAPEAAPAFRSLQAEIWTADPPDRLVLVDGRIAQLLRDAPGPAGARATSPQTGARLVELSRWSTSSLFGDEERACLGFTEQFVIDVAGIDDRRRLELTTALGPAGVLDFVVALFLLDYGRRVTMVLDRLFPDGHPPPGGGVDVGGATAHRACDGGGSGGAALLAMFDRLSRTVALLEAVDPVTTELVRLRGARQHDCRLCQSTRSVRALEAGADEALFDTTERYEASELPEPQKVALRLTDAMVTQPTTVDGNLVDQVHRWFTPQQVVELVLDVMRNSGQKVAVALAADAPHVASGVERFAITATGEVEYLP